MLILDLMLILFHKINWVRSTLLIFQLASTLKLLKYSTSQDPKEFFGPITNKASTLFSNLSFSKYASTTDVFPLPGTEKFAAEPAVYK